MLRRTLAKMSPIPAAEIPSLTLLYKLHKLTPSQNHQPLAAGATSAHNDRVALLRGDITSLAVDAIVNAANTSLMGGGGVDGAIHRAAGPQLIRECATLGGCPTGSAKITSAYELPCKKVIHAVGPVYDDMHPLRSAEKLAGCYRTSLELATRNGVRTIAFAGISTGIYGYPSVDAAEVACGAVKTFLEAEEGQKGIDKVVFVTFEDKDVRAYNATLPRFFPPAGEESKSEDKAAEAEVEAKAEQLPSAPTTDPSGDEHATKKQKPDE